jgi:hypothetical protein
VAASPTARPLLSAELRGWGSADDLTDGAWLRKYCPTRCGPSDIDSEPWRHVLHNRFCDPHREATTEYKPVEATLPTGQKWVAEDRPGDWTRGVDGLRVDRRYFIVYYFGTELLSAPIEIVPRPDGLHYERLLMDSADELARHICGWLWPQ